MKVKHVDKHYLYLRDQQQCFFCKRPLVYGKVSLDHYLPRSAGGTDDVFNLVTSCKRCNGYKQSRIPEDVETVHIRLFIEGVRARKILPQSALGIGCDGLIQMVGSVSRSKASGDETWFESASHRFVAKDNKIVAVMVIHQIWLDDEQ